MWLSGNILQILPPPANIAVCLLVLSPNQPVVPRASALCCKTLTR